jgi:hypothetical protein
MSVKLAFTDEDEIVVDGEKVLTTENEPDPLNGTGRPHD